MKPYRVVVGGLVFLALGVLLGRASAPSVTTALLGRAELSEYNLHARLQELPPADKARYQTPEGRRAFLEGALRTELFARAAVEEGALSDKTFVASIRRALAD